MSFFLWRWRFGALVTAHADNITAVREVDGIVLASENMDQTSLVWKCLEHPPFSPHPMGWTKMGSQQSHPSQACSYEFTTTRSDTLCALANISFVCASSS